MVRIHPAGRRGRTLLGWLDSRHSFSFGEYFDPEKMGFRALRVINDDRIAPGSGFPTHPHRDMEIVTIVLEGGLRHADALGNSSVIHPGEVQRMSAGTGITHSEFNASPTEAGRFLQIWILPERRGLAPGYEQKIFSRADREGTLRLVAAPDGREGALTIHQDVEIRLGALREGDEVRHAVRPGRHAWLQVATGALQANGHDLAEGDGLEMSDEGELVLRATSPSEVVVFDLA